MQYIKSNPNPSGAYPAPRFEPFSGCLPLTDGQAAVLIQYNGFVTITQEPDEEIEGSSVTVTPDLEAWEAWKSSISTNSELLNSAKKNKIALSNSLLEDFLASHPITWVDGQKYSVTEEKQSLLTSNIALYQLSVQAGTPRELKWNTTGDVCTVWTIENLSALALAIGDYVQPYVTYQQTVEVQIKQCSTVEQVEAIVIDYSSVQTVAPEVLSGEQGS